MISNKIKNVVFLEEFVNQGQGNSNLRGGKPIETPILTNKNRNDKWIGYSEFEISVFLWYGHFA